MNNSIPEVYKAVKCLVDVEARVNYKEQSYDEPSLPTIEGQYIRGL
jgi:hypothetical protein